MNKDSSRKVKELYPRGWECVGCKEIYEYSLPATTVGGTRCIHCIGEEVNDSDNNSYSI